MGIPFKYHLKSWETEDDDYYVKKKYGKFEDEIAEYDSKNFNYMIFKHVALTKAKQYMATKLIKSIPGAKKYNHYGLSEGNRISLEHVISIILYCDYSELSSDFSATFRKSSPFEPLSITKHRHRKYWWWSYLLLQTVQIYGSSRYSGLTGPFFTGISFMMTLPQFNIHLISPTSTSVHVEVAMKFSGQQGIILEFHNHRGFSETVRAFDVSGISRYPEEDERYYTCSYSVFFG